MNPSIIIECPACKRKTKLTTYAFLEGHEYDEEMRKFSSDTSDMITPQFTKSMYHALRDKLHDETSTGIALAKLESHKIGLFKEECKNSNKAYKVALYYFMNHNEQTAGMTFRIGEEIKYAIETLSFAETLSQYYKILGKESISIILAHLSKSKQIILTGDVSTFLYLAPETRYQFQVIEADSTMKPDELREFMKILRDRLEDNGEKVRVAIYDNRLYTIECFKDNEWKKCVAMSPKGYTLS